MTPATIKQDFKVSSDKTPEKPVQLSREEIEDRYSSIGRDCIHRLGNFMDQGFSKK